MYMITKACTLELFYFDPRMVLTAETLTRCYSLIKAHRVSNAHLRNAGYVSYTYLNEGHYLNVWWSIFTIAEQLQLNATKNYKSM